MKPTIALYDASTIDQLPWPRTADGAYAKDYLLPLIKQGPEQFGQNIHTRMFALLIDDLVLPVTVNAREYANSYVVSPYTHYVSYAKEELYLVKNRLIKQALAGFVSSLGTVMKLGRINQVVQVNNWLLSTNLYPVVTAEQVAAILAFLRERFPRHTILWRSINPYSDGALYQHLREHGASMLPSRQTYFIHPSVPGFVPSKAKWLTKRDYALLNTHGYEVVRADGLSHEDIPRLLALYNALYVTKYSVYNPQWTERFLELALDKQILHIAALRKAGKIDAVLGYFCRNGVMTTPLFGYDTSQPQSLGLYRMLSAVLLQIASENGHLLNESSGAAQFKRNRGAVGAGEYSAVFHRHLPLYRRIPWMLLTWIVEKVGVLIMKKYKL